MSGRYAADTSVSSEKSRGEIERTLARYGASSFMYGWDQNRAIVGFIAYGRQIRFELAMPDRKDRSITHTPGRGLERSAPQQEAEYEQQVRQKWRALALVIKAKLEAVEAGIVTFEEEFGMFMVLPDGRSAKDHVLPAISKAYESGRMVDLLPPTLLAIEA